jgi:hypothetical protein
MPTKSKMRNKRLPGVGVSTSPEENRIYFVAKSRMMNPARSRANPFAESFLVMDSVEVVDGMALPGFSSFRREYRLSSAFS